MESKRATFLLRETLEGVKAIADAEKANGQPVSSFEPETVVFGLKLLNIPYASYEKVFSKIIDKDVNGYCFRQFIKSVRSLLDIGYDYTILAHRAFFHACEDELRRYHPLFEFEPEEERHRYLGPLMVSPDEANAYSEVLMCVIADLMEFPEDKKAFLLDHSDAFVDYHVEYVSLNLFEIGNIYGPSTLTDFLSCQTPEVRTDGKALRPICKLCPVLQRPELAHVVEYFDRSHSSYVANQHYAELFSAPYIPDLL